MCDDPSFLVTIFPADVDSFFDSPFKPFMFIAQYKNVFVLKERVLSGVEVEINGRVDDYWCALSPMVVHTLTAHNW